MRKFTGMQYLMIDIANSYGLDKKSWEERIAWVTEHKDCLEAYENEADSPCQYYAGVKAFRQAQQHELSGYMISLDATSSGPQLLSIITGDATASKLCNVVSTGEREDLYTNLFSVFSSLNLPVTREQVKKAIMTYFYGSVAKPKEVFGEYYPQFRTIVHQLCKGPADLNDLLLAVWDNTATEYSWVMPDGFFVHFNVERNESIPFVIDGVEDYASVKVVGPTEGGRCLGANLTHSLDGLVCREMITRCNLNRVKILALLNNKINENKSLSTTITTNPKNQMVQKLWNLYKETGFLSARILANLTPENLCLIDELTPIVNLANSLPDKPFEVISIHDCFKCLPNYGNDIRQQYISILMQLADADMLSYLLSKILRKEIKVAKLTDNLSELIAQSEYAIC